MNLWEVRVEISHKSTEVNIITSQFEQILTKSFLGITYTWWHDDNDDDEQLALMAEERGEVVVTFKPGKSGKDTKGIKDK